MVSFRVSTQAGREILGKLEGCEDILFRHAFEQKPNILFDDSGHRACCRGSTDGHEADFLARTEIGE
jgi:hypothetical protein